MSAIYRCLSQSLNWVVHTLKSSILLSGCSGQAKIQEDIATPRALSAYNAMLEVVVHYSVRAIRTVRPVKAVSVGPLKLESVHYDQIRTWYSG